MKFAGKEMAEAPLDEAPDDRRTPGLAFGSSAATQVAVTDDRNVFWDCEVYPNLFVICWKFEDADNIVKMINPTSAEVEMLFKLKLIGFNNRRYDNHMLYGRFMGMSNKQLFDLSQKIINNDRNSMFAEAYNISYADIYDFSSKKQGLKKFMIDLGIHKMEMDIPWDEDVPEDMIPKVVDYCCNDVLGTEATFKDRKADFVARQILAELSGLTVNDTTAKHTARIIFGADRNPQQKFVYTDLSQEFPGYTFDFGKSEYWNENPSEGGYVYAEPGIYEDVAVLDVASMHPTSLIKMNYFGEYTGRYEDLLKARMAIKHKKFDVARQMLDGKLRPYLEDETQAKDLSYALKIVINIVYGMTSAKFDNPFRHVKNKDNIVAKRGALFMINLKHFVQDELGKQVVHIKTDSIKIPGATAEDIAAVTEYGKRYGYDFEHETTYKKFCLVNDAVYIAKKEDGKWEAVGAQFQHPYVFKTLFSQEPVTPDDYFEAKQVQKGTMYLDFDAAQNPNGTQRGAQFIGRTGRFIPVKPESGGGVLYRNHEGKNYAVAGTKGYFWLEAEMAEQLGSELQIDMAYFEALTSKAIKDINKFGDFEEFLK
jgi:DNA polymerase elongation subunit (family B)